MREVNDDELPELDLHRRTLQEAAELTREFVVSALRTGWTTLIIVTGKGSHSKGGVPVLRPGIAGVLKGLIREGLVTTFQLCSLHREGAFRVELPRLTEVELRGESRTMGDVF